MSVEFRRVGKDYGNRPALRDIDVTVPTGAFVALIGPSGCGKSTLLRMVAGLEHIDYGEIRIAGRTVNDLAPRDRGVAMVFQNYALYPHMTVRENLGFGLRMARVPPDTARARIETAARTLGLQDLLDRYPRQLSGGQRQRVAMGRAIVRQPEVFLFDEPLSNLDAQLRIEMRSEIKRLHRSLGATVIFVTHDQVEAMTMADTVVVLREGRIEQIGSPLDLYDDPANAFVATFLGAPAMNLIAGRLVPGEGGAPLFLRDPSLRLPLVGRSATAIEPAGTDCRIGIRPEHVAVRLAGEASPGPAEVAGRVVLAEATGADTFLTLATDVGEIVAMVRGRTDLSPGQEVVAAPDPARLVVFGAADGRRIA